MFSIENKSTRLFSLTNGLLSFACIACFCGCGSAADNTQFSEKSDIQAFDALKIGEGEADVEMKLGAPFYKSQHGEYYRWGYSEPIDKSHDYMIAELDFMEGVLVDKHMVDSE